MDGAQYCPCGTGNTVLSKTSLDHRVEKEEKGIQVFKPTVFPSSSGTVGILVTSVIQSMLE